MSGPPVRIEIHGRRLDAVPAVHFRVAFAGEVHRLCSDPATRPAAIAVELDPVAAAAAAAWLRELGVGPGRRTTLPCMLALAGPAPAGRTPADRMMRVLHLSPADSIVEAIRCAVELDVPLYGVDLEETAGARDRPLLLEDPASAAHRLGEYVRGNAPYADFARDDGIDGRRESAMAARLRTVLARHGRVLFTGGIAHWPRLERLLRDEAVPPEPAEPAGAEAPPALRRFLVHPALAVRYMDLFPAFVEGWETVRRPADRPGAFTPGEGVDFAQKFAQLLGAAYDEHLAPRQERQQIDRRLEDLEARADFEQLLAGLCVVDQRRIPDMYTTLLAAKGTMSPGFCERLAGVMMRFPWAAPEDFRDLPVLAPAPDGGEERAEIYERVPGSSHYWRRRGVVGVSSREVGGPGVGGPLPWSWREWPPPEEREWTGVNQMINWPPVDDLVTAMSLRAMSIASERGERRRVEPFDGSMLDGLHLKSTLRAHARGDDDRYFVRDVLKRRASAKSPSEGWDPIVWIFRLGRLPGSEWDLLIDPVEEFFRYGYFENPDAVRARVPPRSHMVEQVMFARRRGIAELDADSGAPPAVRACRAIDHAYELQGILLYCPCHFASPAAAAWAERTECRRNPFVPLENPFAWGRRTLSPEVLETFRTRYGVELDPGDWPGTMVRMAVPFAERGVTVVAPDSFALPDSIFGEAARRGKEIRVVPHSFLPRTALRKMSLWFAVPARVDQAGARIDEGISRAFGEEPSANRRLLPAQWADYGVRRREAGERGAGGTAGGAP